MKPNTLDQKSLERWASMLNPTYKPSHTISPSLMWQITINCSADDWRINGTAFKDLVAKYPATLLSSKKMHGDERRIMEYQIENVSDAEDFTDECMTLAGFTAAFESL
jgi:hypothetical protein